MEAPVKATSATRSPRFLRRLLHRKVAVLCVAYLGVVVAIGLIGPLLFPAVVRENAGDLLAVHQGPSRDHLLGTDSLGRDVLLRLLVGTRVTVVGVAQGLAVALALGVPLGLAAGYWGGWLDRVAGRLADLAFSMPGIIVILVVVSVYPQNTLAGMATFGILVAPGLMRIVRSAVLPVKEELYIAAARVSGLSGPYIVIQHVLPRVAGVVIVQASVLAAAALLVQSGLSFLGLLVAPPAPTWGGMIAEAVHVIVVQPWLIWPPGIAIAATAVALGLLGDEVRDITTEVWSAPVLPSRSRAHRGQVVSIVAPSGALLSVQGLGVSFQSSMTERVQVVDDVSFDVGTGETVGIVGESGCGKSTTAMAILGLLSRSGRIDRGRIVFNGRDLVSLSDREMRAVRGKKIGLISQEPMVSLNPVFTVGWQIAEVIRRHHGVSDRAVNARVLELLGQVQLPDPRTVARRYAHELSGGMAQRVSIARALAGDPKLLIADEPTSALDVTVQAEILNLLRDLQRERGMAILLVTHDWGVVADMCDRVVVMYAGQVVERAQALPLFQMPLHPYTEALFLANPRNADATAVLPAIPGAVPQPGRWPTGCHFHPRCRLATATCRENLIPIEHPATDRETRCIHHDRLRAAT
jgi:peptide/nickel transport system permease protein